MSNPIHSSILRALFVAVKPLARALLRAGIGYREFADVAKAAFIHEASKEFGLRGRPTNISRVAVMTGITRKEVKSLRDQNIQNSFSGSISESPASIVLSRWFSDSRFCDSSGDPKILSYDDVDDSFTQLIRTYAGDIPPGAMRSELKRVGAIIELPDKKLRVVKRYFVPTGVDDRLMIGLVDVAGPSLETLAHNCDPNRKASPRIHRVASFDNVPRSLLPLIESEATLRLGELAESFDSYLLNVSEIPCQAEDVPKSGIQAGIGLFYFERPID
jgi:Family of unknown function (DUF6502)